MIATSRQQDDRSDVRIKHKALILSQQPRQETYRHLAAELGRSSLSEPKVKSTPLKMTMPKPNL